MVYGDGLILAGLMTLVVVGIPLVLLGVLLVYRAWRGGAWARWTLLVLALLALGISTYGAVYDAFLVDNDPAGWCETLGCGGQAADAQCESRTCGRPVPYAYLAVAVVSAVLAVGLARIIRRAGRGPDPSSPA
jgi:hypothetical protein